MKKQIDITAHRGNSQVAPENTLSAVNAAVIVGADYGEIDVQQTKDGELIIFHDSNLSRITGVKRNIWELSTRELQKLDVGSWFSPDFAGERIPLLEEVLDLARGKIKLNLELKMHGHETNFTSELVKTLLKKDMVRECVVSSLNYDILLEIKQNISEVKIGLIMAKSLENLTELKVDFYSIYQNLATREFIDAAHFQNKKVHVWTVNEKLAIQKMIDLDIDNLITDVPKIAQEILITPHSHSEVSSLGSDRKVAPLLTPIST